MEQEPKFAQGADNCKNQEGGNTKEKVIIEGEFKRHRIKPLFILTIAGLVGIIVFYVLILRSDEYKRGLMFFFLLSGSLCFVGLVLLIIQAVRNRHYTLTVTNYRICITEKGNRRVDFPLDSVVLVHSGRHSVKVRFSNGYVRLAGLTNADQVYNVICEQLAKRRGGTAMSVTVPK